MVDILDRLVPSLSFPSLLSTKKVTCLNYNQPATDIKGSNFIRTPLKKETKRHRGSVVRLVGILMGAL